MAIKLKLRIPEGLSALALRAAAFGLLLVGLEWGGGTVLPILLFIAGSIVLYGAPNAQALRYARTFTVFVGIAILFRGALYGVALWGWYAAAVLIFFGTLGIKNIYFIHRLRLHYLLAFALQGIALFAFLLADKSELFLIKSLLLALASFFVWRDFFGNVAGEGVENESSCIALQFPGVVSGIAAYAMLQVAWAAQLLPIGIVYGGYIAALAAFSMTNLYFHYLQGTLTRAMVLTRVTILLLAGTFIFAVASLVA